MSGGPIAPIKTADQIGKLIRARRMALGWTQADLAARCGTGVRFIVDLEAGKPSCQLGKSLLAAAEVGLRLTADVRPPGPEAPDDELAHIPRF